MQALLILGNQLFSPEHFPTVNKSQTIVFMREDIELCTHFKYHKHKIIFFLAAMRKYAHLLREAGFKVHYEHLDNNGDQYEDRLCAFLKKHKIETLYFFEIEDRFFEKRIKKCIGTLTQLKSVEQPSPMFLTTRALFKEYLNSTKKPFMKTFYQAQRKRLNILVTTKGEPEGGQWSYDEDNRLKLPDGYEPPPLPAYVMDSVDKEVAKITQQHFADHPGDTASYWLPNHREGAQKWLKDFLEQRLKEFGPYEDALSPDFPFVHHSVLTPFLNTGLLTPQEVISETLSYAKKKKLPLNSVEGFIRQVIGWREFIRGIYQNFDHKQETTNFWNHTRKLKPCWYDAKTGITPLDDVIKKVRQYGYAHHIERLMVVGSLMLLCEVEPKEAHKWFMEMFIDSSDWVMGPNVYGMALFSDGGIFATKPYFCGSNYYRKMGPYKKGKWQEGVDGLYWGFIDRHRSFFLKNPRLSMMVKTFDRMDKAKKDLILNEANTLKERITHERT
jgi:deoxyribodipyrimidine photolyase-related protein